MSQVSKNIRHLRKLHNYTQEEFAEILGIKRSSLGAYEEGRATPNFSTLMQLGKLFGLTIEQIVSAEVATLISEPQMSLVNANLNEIDLHTPEVFDVFEQTDTPLKKDITEKV
jgi:transcriptional regulator with XRE-family HTH domain